MDKDSKRTGYIALAWKIGSIVLSFIITALTLVVAAATMYSYVYDDTVILLRFAGISAALMNVIDIVIRPGVAARNFKIASLAYRAAARDLNDEVCKSEDQRTISPSQFMSRICKEMDELTMHLFETNGRTGMLSHFLQLKRLQKREGEKALQDIVDGAVQVEEVKIEKTKSIRQEADSATASLAASVAAATVVALRNAEETKQAAESTAAASLDNVVISTNSAIATSASSLQNALASTATSGRSRRAGAAR
jgi:hypothetical protein